MDWLINTLANIYERKKAALATSAATPNYSEELVHYIPTSFTYPLYVQNLENVVCEFTMSMMYFWYTKEKRG